VYPVREHEFINSYTNAAVAAAAAAVVVVVVVVVVEVVVAVITIKLEIRKYVRYFEYRKCIIQNKHAVNNYRFLRRIIFLDITFDFETKRQEILIPCT
jgi:hypothetical protein